MNTKNISFHGEKTKIRKVSNLFLVEIAPYLELRYVTTFE